jgi:hypothetical protein
MLAASVPVLVWFFREERRAAQHGRDPVIDLDLFRLVSFRRGLAMITAYFFGGSALFLILSLYEQQGLGSTPLDAVKTFIGFAIALLLSSIIATRHVARRRMLFLHVGFGLICVGLAIVVAGLATADRGDARTAIFVGLAVYGLGQGGVSPVMFASAISAVPLRSAGAASGVLSTCTQVSSAVGITLIGLVFSTVLAGGQGALTHAHAAMWALSINLASMLGAALLAWRLPKASATSTVIEPGPTLEP